MVPLWPISSKMTSMLPSELNWIGRTLILRVSLRRYVLACGADVRIERARSNGRANKRESTQKPVRTRDYRRLTGIGNAPGTNFRKRWTDSFLRRIADPVSYALAGSSCNTLRLGKYDFVVPQTSRQVVGRVERRVVGRHRAHHQHGVVELIGSRSSEHNLDCELRQGCRKRGGDANRLVNIGLRIELGRRVRVIRHNDDIRPSDHARFHVD